MNKNEIYPATEAQIDDALRKTGVIGMAMGAFVVAVLFLFYMHAANLQPVPQCHEDEVVLWNDVVNYHNQCVPYDDLPILEEAGVGPAIHGEVTPFG